MTRLQAVGDAAPRTLTCAYPDRTCPQPHPPPRAAVPQGPGLLARVSPGTLPPSAEEQVNALHPAGPVGARDFLQRPTVLAKPP